MSEIDSKEEVEHQEDILSRITNSLKNSEGLARLLSQGKISVILDESSDDSLHYQAKIISTTSSTGFERKSIPFYLYQLMDSNKVSHKNSMIKNGGMNYSWLTSYNTYEWDKTIQRRRRQVDAVKRARNLEQGKSLDAPFDPAEGLIPSSWNRF